MTNEQGWLDKCEQAAKQLPVVQTREFRGYSLAPEFARVTKADDSEREGSHIAVSIPKDLWPDEIVEVLEHIISIVKGDVVPDD